MSRDTRGPTTCEQDAKLKVLWDDHGGAGGAAAAIAADMGLPRSVVTRRIKQMGLKRGVLTQAQVLAQPLTELHPSSLTAKPSQP